MQIPSIIGMFLIINTVTGVHGAALQSEKKESVGNNKKRTSAECSPFATHLSPSVIRATAFQRLDNSPLGYHYSQSILSPQTPQTPQTPMLQRKDEEDSALIKAIEEEDLLKVMELISNGANVNERGKEGESLFYFASHVGDKSIQERIIAALHKAGAQPCEHFKYQMSIGTPFTLPQAATPSASN